MCRRRVKWRKRTRNEEERDKTRRRAGEEEVGWERGERRIGKGGK